MRIEELKTIIEKYPVHMPVRQVAKFLGCSEDGLRASMDQGRCPFGFSWRLGERAGYKIPTITFVMWVTKGAIPLDNF